MMVAGFLFLFQSCLKDDITTIEAPNLEDNAVLLNYLETNGNYINSDEMPSIVNVDEVYSNLNNYLIIDVRGKQEYTSGHIQGAINIQNDSLIIYFDSKLNWQKYSKVILVSSDGQAAAYYTCLLRLYGINNVYSLNFGMALWNRNFSDVWIENLKDHKIENYLDGSRLYPSDVNMKLPEINFDQSNGYTNGIKNLILNTVKQGFNSNTYVNLTPFDTTIIDEEGTAIFYFDGEELSNFYIACFGSPRLYNALVMFPLPSGHIPGAYFYNNGYIQSSTFLQSFPPDKKIVVYSLSGQTSAFITAYLRVLGYDAKSLSYGAHVIFYSRLLYDINFFAPYVFRTGDIRNYPYVRGSSLN